MTAAPFTDEQKHYLDGFFSGVKARGVAFTDIAPNPAAAVAAPASPALDDLTKEERIKRELYPFDAYEQLVLDARHNAAPDPEMVFRHKWNGLFWLTPVKDAYMCRLRIPGGVVQSHQARELAKISRDLTSGYIQITTRNNFQIRQIEPKNCPEVLRRIQSCGLHSKGSGADNIRNITASPTAGIDPHEIFDTTPLVHELSQIIISSKEFYDLPRKFNIAFDGGGLVSAVEDTNDIGATAVEIAENSHGIAPGVYFRIALGGVTGHQHFANDWGVLVAPDKLNQVILAILRVFIRDGDRTNRKKARLKHLLDKCGPETFRDQVETKLGWKLIRLASDDASQLKRNFSQQGHHHIGVWPQKQPGLFYIGAHVPVGQMTPKQLEKLATYAESYGSGEIRLTVWQNFIIPNVPEAYVKTLCKSLAALGFPTVPSNLRSGFIACTGATHCKFAAARTKENAIEMMNYLDRRVHLDHPINIHFTGCANSCAQHYMGDIGLLAAKVKFHGETIEGYHIVVGGGFGENRKIGRQLFTGVAMPELGPTLETILKSYLAKRATPEERFQDFCNRHEIKTLQEIFSPDAK